MLRRVSRTSITSPRRVDLTVDSNQNSLRMGLVTSAYVTIAGCPPLGRALKIVTVPEAGGDGLTVRAASWSVPDPIRHPRPADGPLRMSTVGSHWRSAAG